jgi:predicted NUDIX family phosphoesterase
MSGNALKKETTQFDTFMAAAQRAQVIVADVFAALRRGEITEDECKAILAAFERASVPRWQRVITST